MPGGLRLKPQWQSWSGALMVRRKFRKIFADHLAAPPASRFVVAYVPAASSVGEALRFLDLPDEDYVWIQIAVSPDSDHVIFVERKSNCKACPLDHN
jgi:hypothetical protein